MFSLRWKCWPLPLRKKWQNIRKYDSVPCQKCLVLKCNSFLSPICLVLESCLTHGTRFGTEAQIPTLSRIPPTLTPILIRTFNLAFIPIVGRAPCDWAGCSKTSYDAKDKGRDESKSHAVPSGIFGKRRSVWNLGCGFETWEKRLK